MIYHRQLFAPKYFSPKVTLFFLAPLVLLGCATTPQYPSTTKFINTHEISEKETSSNKIANLTYDQLIRKADTYLNNKQYRLAGLHYQKAFNNKPHSIPATLGLTKVLLQSDEFEKAAQLLTEALEANPNNAPALTLMGIVERQRGELSASLDWLGKAVEQDSKNPQILTELAITNDYIGQERLTYAEDLYKRVLSLKPNSSPAHNNLGFNYLLQGRHQDAIHSLNRALSLSKDNNRAKNNLAAAYLLADQAPKAINLFQNTVGLAAAYNNLGYIYLTRGDRQQAEQAFQKALQLNPTFYVRAQQNLQRLDQVPSLPH